ncbi:DMT family transporter [Desulfonatronovibrio magnus]|uniref:DMT family transporter n=1 Tax=Desulfonatronovibrio magnus TaxID=698827 RepID=UPI0005EBB57C|nr:EamA family transporter [Desulfonatronovibrio magnus]
MVSNLEKIKGFALILTAAALWGGIGPVAKSAFAQGMTPLEVAFWRAIIGWLFFALHAISIQQMGIKRNDFPVMLVFGLVCVTGFYGSYQLAVDLGGAAKASVLLYTAPAWVAVLAMIFLKEKISLPGALSITACIVGVAMISAASDDIAGHEFSLAGIIFGLIAGFTYALYYIFGKKLFARYHPVTIFFWILILGALGLIPFINITWPDINAWPALIFLGFFTTYVAYFVYSRGLARLKASQAAVVATMEPVVAALLAYLFWQENLGLWGYAGAAVIISGVIMQAGIRAEE